MTTSRSVILSSVANTLTTVYTNSSGATSTLKSVNINGLADLTNLNGAAGGDEWSYFGSNINIYAPLSPAVNSSLFGAGIPVVVNLSADRLLFMWLPHYMHTTAGSDFPVGAVTALHTQIVEYTGSKYRAAPIVNVNIGSIVNTYTSLQPALTYAPNGMSGTYGATHFKAIALTSTKVVCAIRYGSAFSIFRLNINGNTVELSSVVNLSVTGSFGTAAYDYDLATVIDDTNQVVIMAGDATSWKMRAFSVPDSGAITALGAGVFNTAITGSNTGYQGAITLLNKTLNGGLNYYSVFGSTASTTASIQHVSYNSSTNTFAVVGTAATVSSAGSAWYGIKGACLSTGSTINGVFFTTDPSATSSYRYYRQTSIAGATSTLSTTAAPRAAQSAWEIRAAYNWGDERAVFVGANYLVAIDSAGTVTDLLPAADTTNTSSYTNYWFNFQSRPIYSFYDPATVKLDRVTQYYSRTGMTSSTNLGVRTDLGNYVPWGFEYGHHYDWSDAAGCWFVGQYGKIYAISADGDLLDEVSLNTFFPDITSSQFQYDIRNLVVLPSGRILVTIMPFALTHISYTYHGTGWTTLATTAYAATLAPVTNPRELNKAYTLNSISLANMATTSHLTWHVDFNGEERAYLLWHNGAAAPVTVLTQYYGGAWQTSTTTAVGSTSAGAWNVGLLSNFRLVQDVPSSSLYPRGLWRIVGGLGTDTLVNIRYLYVSTSRWDPLASAASFTTTSGVILHQDGSTVGRYGMYSRRSRNISVSATHDVAANITRVWTSYEGKLPSFYGWFSSANTANTRYVTSAVTSGGYIIAYNNTSGNSFPTAPAYVFDGANTANNRVLFNTPSNNGVYTVKQTGTTSMQIFNANSIGNTYTITTPTDSARFTLALLSGSNTFFIANQMVSTSNTTNIRTNDTYLIANGASIRISADKPNALTAMLSIVEEV